MWDDAKQMNAIAATLVVLVAAALLWAGTAWVVRGDTGDVGRLASRTTVTATGATPVVGVSSAFTREENSSPIAFARSRIRRSARRDPAVVWP